MTIWNQGIGGVRGLKTSNEHGDVRHSSPTTTKAGSTCFGNVLDVHFWPKAGEAATAALSLVCPPSHRHNLLKNIFEAFCRTVRSRCNPAHCTCRAFRIRELPCSTEQSSTEQRSTEQFRSVRLAYPADLLRSAREARAGRRQSPPEKFHALVGEHHHLLLAPAAIARPVFIPAGDAVRSFISGIGVGGPS
jgi:hypothetical protein